MDYYFEYWFSLHNWFLLKEISNRSVGQMSERLKQIQREIASLKKDLEELRRLKSDCDQARNLRKRLVRIEYD